MRIAGGFAVRLVLAHPAVGTGLGLQLGSRPGPELVRMTRTAGEVAAEELLVASRPPVAAVAGLGSAGPAEPALGLGLGLGLVFVLELGLVFVLGLGLVFVLVLEPEPEPELELELELAAAKRTVVTYTVAKRLVVMHTVAKRLAGWDLAVAAVAPRLVVAMHTAEGSSAAKQLVVLGLGLGLGLAVPAAVAPVVGLGLDPGLGPVAQMDLVSPSLASCQGERPSP